MMWRGANVGAAKIATIGLGAAFIICIYTARLLLKSRRRRKITKIIDTIDEFQKPNLRMRDPQRVEELVCQLIRGGRDRLQVIVDFDMTLSRFHRNGTQCQTCHGALATSPLMGTQFQEKTQALYKRYHPIELDSEMTMKEKEPFMKEWWEQSHGAFLQNPLNRADLTRIVRSSKVILRNGCDTFFEMLNKYDVPILIFSAGLGDVLTEVLRQQVALYDNVKTVSNFMEFNANGLCCGFKGETIHCCNKNASALENTDYSRRTSGRTNVILMGDSLGDLSMANGVKDLKTNLKIGFLNEKMDELFPQYAEAYDIVLLDDQTLDLVNGLLAKIL